MHIEIQHAHGSLESNHVRWWQINSANDAACREVLKVAGADSLRQLESRIFFDRDLEPDPIRLHRFRNFRIIPEHERSNEDVTEFAEPIFRGPFRTEDFREEIYADNLPYQADGRWYALYQSPERPFYFLGRFDRAGTLEKERTIHSLACGDRSFDGGNGVCGCRIEDASGPQPLLLAYCRTQHGDFTSSIQRQWLAVFRSDELTGVGAIRVSGNQLTNQFLATGDGNAYVLAVDYGETLRVYEVPAHF